MIASQRKLQRTRRAQLQQIENMNHNAIAHILKNQNYLFDQFIEFQKHQLALTQALKRRGIVDDLMLHKELSLIEEMEEMKKKALILDPSKVKL